MAGRRKVVWTDAAKADFKEICNYWNNRNRSNRYSQTLRELTTQRIRDVANFYPIGANSDFVNVKFVLVRDYQVFYQIFVDKILILSFWDGRQDPQKLIKRLE